jgi:hypothetical protein
MALIGARIALIAGRTVLGAGRVQQKPCDVWFCIESIDERSAPQHEPFNRQAYDAGVSERERLRRQTRKTAAVMS